MLRKNTFTTMEVGVARGLKRDAESLYELSALVQRHFGWNMDKAEELATYVW